LHGIICYSNKPIHFISLVGFFTSLISFVLILLFIFLRVSGYTNVTGLTTILVLLSFFSGLILFSLGIIGEYIGRMFDEIKQRPRYIVDKEYID
jgi:dolichol-phosphate mannosyltransferase